MRRLCCADVGAYRDDHADVSGERRRAGTHEKTHGSQNAELIGKGSGTGQQHEQHCRHDPDRPVLPVHVCAGSFLNSLRNLLHLRVAGVQFEHPHRKVQTVGDAGHGQLLCREGQATVPRG